MSSAASTGFYKIITKLVWCKFFLECSPFNSCNCYTNLKRKNNENNMIHKDCMYHKQHKKVRKQQCLTKVPSKTKLIK